MTRRDDVVTVAAGELGEPTPDKLAKYWKSVGLVGGLEGGHPHLSWCGIFALYCLHGAGLALDKNWKIGAGFILQQPHPLPVTHSPQPGDIGYVASPFQHHFIVETVDGPLVHSIDGNQPDIRRKTRAISAAITFYSIEPLLAAVELPSPSAPPPPEPSPFVLQRAVNAVILAHPLDAPNLLKVDGVIGPLSKAAIAWCEAKHPGELHV